MEQDHTLPAFPIVGIGASVAGLPALEAFFSDLVRRYTRRVDQNCVPCYNDIPRQIYESSLD